MPSPSEDRANLFSRTSLRRQLGLVLSVLSPLGVTPVWLPSPLRPSDSGSASPGRMRSAPLQSPRATRKARRPCSASAGVLPAAQPSRRALSLSAPALGGQVAQERERLLYLNRRGNPSGLASGGPSSLRLSSFSSWILLFSFPFLKIKPAWRISTRYWVAGCTTGSLPSQVPIL